MASVFQLHIPNAVWLPDAQSDRPAVGIRLGQHGYAIDGSIIVGPLMTDASQLDTEIDRLIAELEALRAPAKQALNQSF
jgi:hypothetical protein